MRRYLVIFIMMIGGWISTVGQSIPGSSDNFRHTGGVYHLNLTHSIVYLGNLGNSSVAKHNSIESSQNTGSYSKKHQDSPRVNPLDTQKLLRSIEAQVAGFYDLGELWDSLYRPTPLFSMLCSGCTCEDSCCKMCPCTSYNIGLTPDSNPDPDPYFVNYQFASPTSVKIGIKLRKLNGKKIRLEKRRKTIGGRKYIIYGLQENRLPEKLTVQLTLSCKARKAFGGNRIIKYNANCENRQLNIDSGY